jgi:single-stranded-DNA-specific exonuclease
MSKWVITAKRADFAEIAQKYRIDPVIARVIRNRDIVGEEEIQKFLYGTPEDIPSPYLLKDVQKAAEILKDKIAEGKKIRVIGDYDIDGVCSTYILVRGLRECGADVDEVIPHRILDGYGLNDSLIQQAGEDKVDTIMTCDNGIAADAQIRLAKELGMTVIVTDHHEVPYESTADGERIECPPCADAVVDPKQKDCGYPFDGICGAVVAYKCVQVLLDQIASGQETKEKLLEELFPFAAFATVGDVMELVKENRIFVKYGLRQLEHTQNPGMRALLEVNKLWGKPLSAYHIGFVLGPCLNATGRLDTAQRALDMFLTEDVARATVIAGELKELNDSRKNMTVQETKRAEEMIDNGRLKEDKVLVVYLKDCHESLAGIIAGRLREKYHKPAFVLTDAEDGVKGSGRSIDAYHMYDRMSECKELYTKYGGHKLAAGVSMPEENIEPFRKFLNAHCGLTEEDFEEKVIIDVPMPMNYVTKKLVEQLSVLEPFGNGNSKPVFAQKNVWFRKGKILGKNANVGKYQVADEQGKEYDLIYFGDLEGFHAFLDEKFGVESRRSLYQGSASGICMSVLYYPTINIYQGREQLQMVMQNYC